MTKEMEIFQQKLKYLGYKGVNLNRVSLSSFKNFMTIMPKINNNIEKLTEDLPNLTLEEIRKLTQEFCMKYFSLHNISIVSSNELIRRQKEISKANDSHGVYENINSILSSVNPLDIDIVLTNGHSMIGQIIKPIVIAPSVDENNRKIYFSNIELGNQLTNLSSATLVHEIAHSQLEQNIGYAEDYLNKELITIFLEKVAALELDPTGELLKISEKMRFNDILNRYLLLHQKKGEINTISDIDNLLYIKSTFYAEKLFDMYINERKQKNRDKYFYDIQEIFDGKTTVEELIRKRNITAAKASDISLLKRHI